MPSDFTITVFRRCAFLQIHTLQDRIFSILPFEVGFFKGHRYPIHYVGNPTVDEVTAFKASHQESFADFIADSELADKPIIALLAGSRKQEIKDNLPDMIRAASAFPGLTALASCRLCPTASEGNGQPWRL